MANKIKRLIKKQAKIDYKITLLQKERDSITLEIRHLRRGEMIEKI